MRHLIQAPTHPTSPALWRIAIGCMLYPIQTYNWLHFLGSEFMQAQGKPILRWLAKIHHPYVSTRLNCTDRVELLIGHYRFLFNAGLGSLVRKASTTPITICEFVGRSGAPYAFEISAMDADRADGELTLRLLANGVCIYTVSFIYLLDEGRQAMKIGGLYGLLATDDTLRIKRITRDIHGCRPKDLMIAIVVEIGNYLGCEKIILTGNKNKIRVAGKRACKKSSDYDHTWTELKATPRVDGDFELPCITWTTNPVTSTQAPDHKRWHASARSTLMDSVLAAVRKQLAHEKCNARNNTSSYSSASPLQDSTVNAPVV